MKKKLFLFTLMLSMLATLHAQGTDLRGTLGLDGYRGIIREKEIAYYEDQGRGFFVHLSTLNGNVYQVNVPEDWHIRDFHVVDEIAYFCGIDSNDYTALLGHFNIKDLQPSMANVSFVRDDGISTELSILNRIAVCKNDETVSLMAIGRKFGGNSPEMYGSDRVLYISDYSLMTGSIFSSTNGNEKFWDVVLTDNYFVTAGTYGLGTTILTMRSLPIGTGLSAFPALFSNGYRYTCSENFLSGVRAANLNNDSIVLSTYVDKASVSITAMNLFTIDVLTAQMDYHQEFYTPITYTGARMLPPREMVYLPDSTALMVIDTNSTGAYSEMENNAYIVRLTPYVTPEVLIPWGVLYVPPVYYSHLFNGIQDSVVVYSSLIATSTSSCMAAKGDSWMKLDLQGGLLPPQHFHNMCIASRNTDCFNMGVFPYTTFCDGDCMNYDRSLSIKSNPVLRTIVVPCQRWPNTPLRSKDEIETDETITDIK